MTSNIGGIDRVLRAVVGVALLGLMYFGVIGWWGWLGVVPLGTAVVGYCPPYALLGFSTCATRGKGA